MKTFQVLRKNIDGGNSHNTAWYYKKWNQTTIDLVKQVIRETEEGWAVVDIKRID